MTRDKVLFFRVCTYLAGRLVAPIAAVHRVGVPSMFGHSCAGRLNLLLTGQCREPLGGRRYAFSPNRCGDFGLSVWDFIPETSRSKLKYAHRAELAWDPYASKEALGSGYSIHDDHFPHKSPIFMLNK
jgi:hypothetical protein